MIKIRALIKEFTSLEASLFRYSLSYCVLLALLPSLIIAIFFIQSTSFKIVELLNLLYQFLPKELLSPFIDYLMNKDYPSFLSLIISLILACYLASKSFFSFMLISASHEDFETYKILIRIKSFGLFIIFVFGIIGTTLVTHILKLDMILTYGIGLFILMYILYRMLSFEKRPISYGVLGAFVTTISVMVVGYLFLFIIREFTSYQNVYGPLSSLVVLLLSIYVISSIIYFGYCLNLVYGKQLIDKQYKSRMYYHIGEKMINKIKMINNKRRTK